MTTWFVSRHNNAVLWAASVGIKATDMKIVQHLDVAKVKRGDTVIGTLPINLAALVCERGATYQHLSLDLPPEARGREVTPEEMRRYGARVEEFAITTKSAKRMQAAKLESPDGLVYVCLVSGQQMQNFLPALQHKPDVVYLVCSDDQNVMRHGKWLQQALQVQGIGARHLTLEMACPSIDLAAIEKYAGDLAGKIESSHPRHAILLNATGGTKPMSMGFLNAMRDLADVIYVDTESEQFQYLAPAGYKPLPLQPDLVDLPRYLAAQGFRILRAESDDPDWVAFAERMQQITYWLVSEARKSSAFLGPLNEAAQNAREQRDWKDPSQISRQFKARQKIKIKAENREAASRVIDGLQERGLVRWDGTDWIEFADNPTAEYLNGMWLEAYAWDMARSAGTHDFKAGVRIEPVDQPVRGAKEDPRKAYNEIDLVLVHRNRMLLVECKTAGQIGQDEFNKLDALNKYVRGTFGSSLLLSARGLSKLESDRAKNYGIQVLQLAAIGELKQVLQGWVRHLRVTIPKMPSGEEKVGTSSGSKRPTSHKSRPAKPERIDGPTATGTASTMLQDRVAVRPLKTKQKARR